MEITDDYMREMMTKTKPYTIVILKKGAKHSSPEAAPITWEHARRNFSLRAAGKLAIVCPVRDESDVVGLGIFACDAEETRRLMDGDPGVQAHIFRYDVHPSRSFPGDAL